MIQRRLKWIVSLDESIDEIDLRIDPGQFILRNENDIRKVYTFQKKIGEGNLFYITKGGFGVVYKGIHNISKNVRAIKQISKATFTSQSESDLLNEVNMLKSLVTV